MSFLRSLFHRRDVEPAGDPAGKAEDAATKTLATHVSTALNSCGACASACEHTSYFAAYGSTGRLMEDVERCCDDVASLCWVATSLLNRTGPTCADFLDFVATACDHCAEECSEHPEGQCQACAESCRRCAADCRACAGELRAAAGPPPPAERSGGPGEHSERRTISTRPELRAAPAGSDSPGTLVGYAAVFNEPSVPMPLPKSNGRTFVERIAPGAFHDCLSQDVRCLKNHEPNILLGRTSAGTLRIAEDARGLRYECDLPDTSHGRDIAEEVRRGDMQGNSFQFDIEPDGESDEWDRSDPKQLTRTVKRFSRIHDVGPATFPAYEATRVDCRSLDQALSAVAAPAPPPPDDSEARARLARLKIRQRLAEGLLIESLPTR